MRTEGGRNVKYLFEVSLLFEIALIRSMNELDCEVIICMYKKREESANYTFFAYVQNTYYNNFISSGLTHI